MDKITCCQCQHFRQHYVFRTNKFVKAFCGHCTSGRSKRRLPDSSACDKFLPKSDGPSIVSKTYLTGVLLRYFLSLELSPFEEESFQEE